MPQGVWVYSEQWEGKFKKVTFELLAKGSEFAKAKNASLSALLFGSGVEPLAGELIKRGADRVLVADNELLKDYTAESYCQLVCQLAKDEQPEIILFPATSLGKDLSARVAARLGVGLATDVTELKLDDSGKLAATRPIYAGKAFAKLSFSEDYPQLASVRPNVLPAAEPSREEGSGQVVKQSVDGIQTRAKVKEFIKTLGERVDITEAEVIVAGGRGIKSQENFKLIEELADVLGAAAGASRAIVDAGWVPHAIQVGQTGKVVSPTLYVACGISGAIQHLAGMSSSKYVIAINKDANAPILKVADFGIVGDLLQVIPALIEELKRVKESG
jgi:electron transfer flavoprotein alpha subunit